MERSGSTGSSTTGGRSAEKKWTSSEWKKEKLRGKWAFPQCLREREPGGAVVFGEHKSFEKGIEVSQR